VHDQQAGTIAAAPFGKKLLLTVREAAQALSICERSLWTLTNEGLLRPVRIGRSVRYAVTDLQAYIDRCRAAADA
jgi:excisionase family DNA binding protein